MLEKSVLQRIRIQLSEAGFVLFRNNSGQYTAHDGSVIRYGVCNPGGSDLLGWKTITITKEMVGQKISQFAAIEVKTSTGKLSEPQRNFLEQVKKSGGIAHVAFGINKLESI